MHPQPQRQPQLDVLRDLSISRLAVDGLTVRLATFQPQFALDRPVSATGRRFATPTFSRVFNRLAGAGGGTRTRTGISPQRILSPLRLPFRHPGISLATSATIGRLPQNYRPSSNAYEPRCAEHDGHAMRYRRRVILHSMGRRAQAPVPLGVSNRPGAVAVTLMAGNG